MENTAFNNSCRRFRHLSNNNSQTELFINSGIVHSFQLIKYDDEVSWPRQVQMFWITKIPATLLSSFKNYLPHHHHHFTALFPGPPGWAAARKELLDFMVQGKINRGRHTNHLDGRHSIQVNQCPPLPSSIFLQAGCPSCRPTNSAKALKATKHSD